MVNWYRWAESFFAMAILLFMGSLVYSFWEVTGRPSSYESAILTCLDDQLRYVVFVGLPLLAAIFCTLMDIGKQLRKGGQG
jgi:hypothetical protein